MLTSIFTRCFHSFTLKLYVLTILNTLGESFVSKIIEHLKKVDIFKNLSTEELTKIERISEQKGFREKTILFNRGDTCSNIYIILVGSVKVYTKINNKEKILSTFQVGENFGELALIDARPRSATAETLESSVLLTISREPFLELLEKNFFTTRKILSEMSRRLRVTNQHVNDLVFHDAKSNIILALINLSKQHGTRTDNVIKINTKINTDDISKYADTSPEVTRLVLQHLESKEIISHRQNAIYIDITNLLNYKEKVEFN